MLLTASESWHKIDVSFEKSSFGWQRYVESAIRGLRGRRCALSSLANSVIDFGSLFRASLKF